jgi:phosphoglycerate dehydrogenase-like enzyme
VGFGRIGRRLAELLGPFDCRVATYDPFLPDEMVQRHGARKLELDELMATSEVLVVCAASNPGTRALIGPKQIEALRRGAVFVNVARAALVDTDALIERLRRGEIYAALDVFDREPLEIDSPLRSLNGAFLTPHRAGGVLESVGRTVSYLADDFEAFLDGRPLTYALEERMIPSLDG